jgi:hypothetical protein
MGLTEQLEAARVASAIDRIVWRDRIAAHGSQAIVAMGPWLADPMLCAFAIRVLERAGANGHASEAVHALLAARSTVPPVVKGDVEWALARLRPMIEPEKPTRRAKSRANGGPP